MAEYVDSAVQTVLSTSRLKLAHPGNAKLTQVYPTPTETTSVLAQAINHRGLFRVSPNNKNLNARSDFIVSSSALISEFVVNGSIQITNVGTDYIKPNAVGWAFDLIESIEITYSNSLMQNMFIRGETLKDYSLLCCTSARERVDLLRAAGEAAYVNILDGALNTYKFSVPITFLNHTTSGLRTSWPVDGSVLAGPIQISINWRSSNYAFVASNTALIAFPSQFESLVLSCKTTQLQDASFTVKKAMMLDPQLVYSLPSRYITSVDYSRSFVVDDGLEDIAPQTINLSSAPSGMLEGIIVSIRPSAGEDTGDEWVIPNATGTNNIKGGSVTLEQIRLEFGGQNIIRTDSPQEWRHYTRSTFGDNLEWPGMYYNAGLAYNIVGTNTSVLCHSIYFLPLVDDGAAVFRGHTNENLPSYGGSQLQLTLKPSYNQFAKFGVGFSRANKLGGNGVNIDGMESSILQQGITYQIWVGFIISGLLEVSQGTVDLQL